jgi:predicted ABC-type ATPase
MPKENPQLTIVGGPNGAGKSTYSGGLSPMGAFVFDADIITARVAAQLPPDVPVESIYFAVQSVFLDFVEEAIKKKRHFTIETNFRDNELMDGEFADIDHLIPAETDHLFRAKLTT